MGTFARRGVAAVVVVTAAFFVTPPASAAARVTAISDGFTASGFAGSQTTVRVTRPVRLTEWDNEGRPFSLTASAGPIAGFALQPADRTSPAAFLVQSTPQWSCGSGGCGGDARLAYGLTFGRDGVLPKGDYLLVLVGAPGARVSVTLAPAAKGARPVRVPLTRRTTPVVTTTTDLVTGTGTDPVGSGRADPRELPGRVLYGILHTVTFDGGDEADVNLVAGRRGWDGRCYGMSLAIHRSALWPAGPVHRTQAMFDERPSGSDPPCAEWRATVKALRSTHRAVAVQVPLAF